MTRPQNSSARMMAVLVIGCASLAGCSGDGDSASASTNGGGLFSGLFGPSQSSTAELTPKQGQKLLADIRKNPSRLQKLTLPERRYLAKAGIDERGERNAR